MTTYDALLVSGDSVDDASQQSGRTEIPGAATRNLLILLRRRSGRPFMPTTFTPSPADHHRLSLAAVASAFKCAHSKALSGQAGILVALVQVRGFLTPKVLTTAFGMIGVSARVA